jgi:predicted outer membrane repeat protein
VTSAKDNGTHSLRAAITTAQSGDTIVLSPKLDGQTITLTTGELDITKNLTIQGPGAGQLTISGNDDSRVFEVAANATVALSGLTISKGNAPVAPAQIAGAGEGGGILNHGTLTVSGCTVSNNYAPFYGGGIYNDGTATVSNTTVSANVASAGGMPGSWRGGGIYNDGRLTVTGGTISGNSSDLGGGIFNADTITVSGCTIFGNSVDDVGGGIYNAGTMTVSGCYVQNNAAYYAGDQLPHGGGIYNAGTAAALTVLDSIFSGNHPDNIFGPYTDGGGNTFS